MRLAERMMYMCVNQALKVPRLLLHRPRSHILTHVEQLRKHAQNPYHKSYLRMLMLCRRQARLDAAAAAGLAGSLAAASSGPGAAELAQQVEALRQQLAFKEQEVTLQSSLTIVVSALISGHAERSSAQTQVVLQDTPTIARV